MPQIGEFDVMTIGRFFIYFFCMSSLFASLLLTFSFVFGTIFGLESNICSRARKKTLHT